MIHNFELKDFKGHEGTSAFELPGLTVVSGTNNSGKSSLLQAMYLLTQTSRESLPLLNLNEKLGLGSFKDVLHKGKSRTRDSMEFFVTFDSDWLGKDGYENLIVRLVFRDQSLYSLPPVSTPMQGNPVLVELEIEYQQKGEEYRYVHFQFDSINGNHPIFRVTGDVLAQEPGYCKMQGVVPDSYYFVDADLEFRSFWPKEFEIIRSNLGLMHTRNIRYLKAFRADEYRDSSMLAGEELGISGEHTAEIIALNWDKNTQFVNSNDGEAYKFSFLFDHWIQVLLGERYRVRSRLGDTGKFEIVVVEEEIELLLHQVGFGISQLLPVLTLILTSKQGDVLLIENPEVHLHPLLQALFVELYVFAIENGRKVVVETHSEHIINRVRLMVKQRPELLKLLKIYFFEKMNGVIQHTPIGVTQEGKLTSWPKNFFDTSYYDLIGLVE